MMGNRLTEEERYMREAVKQAKKAYALGEVPIWLCHCNMKVKL